MVLLVLTIGIVAACSLAASAMANGLCVSSMVNRTAAANAADSMLAQAAERLFATDGKYGLANETLGTRVDANNWQLLTFNSASNGVAFSTNNLNGTVPVSGWEGVAHQVAPKCVDLIATARVNGVQSRRRLLLLDGPFPYAVGVQAPMVGANVSVAAVDKTAQLPSNLALLNLSQLLPANVESDNALSHFAVRLQGNSNHIIGNLQAVGGILAPPHSVQGSVNAGAESVTLPQLQIPSYAPSNAGSSLSSLPQGKGSSATGLVRLPKLNESGKLELDNAVVYVDGDVRIDGGISGTGALFATGSVTLGAGNEFASTDQVAVACQGDLSIVGAGAAQSSFRGLLYTEGSFTASNVSLLGVFVDNAQSSSTAAVNVTNAQIVGVPQFATLSLALPSQAANDTLIFNPTTSGQSGFTVYMNNGNFIVNTKSYPSADLAANAIMAIVGSTQAVGLDHTNNYNSAIGSMVDQVAAPLTQQQVLDLLNKMSQPAAGPGGQPSTTTWTFDLNQFLTFADRAQQLLWTDR
jgi:hypothetical protein